MISNPDLLFYACIAKGPLILAEFSSKESGIETLASQCLEKTPPNHSTFSQTISNRRYTFIIKHPLTYFVILDESLGKSKSLWFLGRLKGSFEDLLESGSVKSFDNLTPYCFQSLIDLIFGQTNELDLDSVGDSGNTRLLDSAKRKKSVALWLKLKKKKKRLISADLEKSVEVREKKIDIPGGDLKVDSCGNDEGNVNRIWRKRLVFILILDLVVFFAMLWIWLWVCTGFQCIQR